MAAEIAHMNGFEDNRKAKDGVELMNGNVLFGKDSVENAPVKENRVIRKAKRIGKMSPRKDEGIVDGVQQVSINGNSSGSRLPFSKNSRRSRSAMGRGLPKKGGAGGKGVWGKPGAELLEFCPDEHDPNYDSDAVDSYKLAKVAPELTPVEAEKTVMPILQEYLEHGDADEVIESLQELNLGSIWNRIVVMAVSLALDRHDPQREMTSRLISDLNGHIFTQEDIRSGFQQLLESLDDLTLDTPEAPVLLGQFIARAIADDCLSMDFLESFGGHIESVNIRRSLTKADVLLSIRHGIAKLDNVWGVGGGNRPVKYLVNKINLLLEELLSSGDVREGTRCLKELDVPHFHHELVYQAIVTAMEKSADKVTALVVNFLKHLTSTGIITEDEFEKGLLRVMDQIGDISLDVPLAYCIMERLGSKLHEEGVLSDKLYKDLPARGRKRFVSEGDGGRVKEDQPLH